MVQCFEFVSGGEPESIDGQSDRQGEGEEGEVDQSRKALRDKREISEHVLGRILLSEIILVWVAQGFGHRRILPQRVDSTDRCGTTPPTHQNDNPAREKGDVKEGIDGGRE